MGIGGVFPSKLKACARHEKVLTVIPPKEDTGPIIDKKMVGLDMAVVMMNAIKTPRGAEEYHQKPPVPALHVANAVLKLVRKLMREGFGVFAVFDRISRHPLKAARAGAIRNRTVASAEAQLDEIIRQSWPTGNKE